MRISDWSSDVCSSDLIGAAATRVFASGMTDGIEELDAVRARYRDEPWYKDVYGNYTHLILGMTAEELRTKGQVYRFGPPVHSEPMPTPSAVDVPQQCALCGQGLDAPAGDTARRLQRQSADGRRTHPPA